MNKVLDVINNVWQGVHILFCTFMLTVMCITGIELIKLAVSYI